MTVYVDELRVWPNARHRCFAKGSSHLWADTLEELHTFARALGMKPEWFQGHRVMPHYDLSPKRHAAALRLGATLASVKEQLRARRVA